MVASPASGSLYDREYYDALRQGMRRSAEAVVPHLIEALRPQSVVDVGCGCGVWAEAFRSRGVGDVLGLDGAWAASSGLEIPAESFWAVDLTQPVRSERRFDLVLCLEVAEHLPPSAAPTLVETLTGLGPVIVFSAAVPCQNGDGHVNEQWPGYWSALFATHGFICIDTLRDRFWTDRNVEVWYRQNLLLFARAGQAADGVRSATQTVHSNGGPRELVHPGLYLRVVEEKAQWQRYSDLLKLRLADLEHEVHRFRSSYLGRVHRMMEKRRAWLREKLAKASERG